MAHKKNLHIPLTRIREPAKNDLFPVLSPPLHPYPVVHPRRMGKTARFQSAGRLIVDKK